MRPNTCPPDARLQAGRSSVQVLGAIPTVASHNFTPSLTLFPCPPSGHRPGALQLQRALHAGGMGGAPIPHAEGGLRKALRQPGRRGEGAAGRVWVGGSGASRGLSFATEFGSDLSCCPWVLAGHLSAWEPTSAVVGYTRHPGSPSCPCGATFVSLYAPAGSRRAAALEGPAARHYHLNGGAPHACSSYINVTRYFSLLLSIYTWPAGSRRAAAVQGPAVRRHHLHGGRPHRPLHAVPGAVRIPPRHPPPAAQRAGLPAGAVRG